MEKLYFDIQVDCESMQHAISNPKLGESALRGLSEITALAGCRASFMVIPDDLRQHAAIYTQLRAAGHEIGVHVHPADQGFQEFLGVYGYDDQVKIVGEAARVFEDCMGYAPRTFTPGYVSANDSTFPALYDLGFRQGMVSLPTRDLPQCACVWGSSPRWCSYAHRHNRCLPGDLDFVNVPETIDPASRMWGGAHPQDLRVELVDAKNHYYTVEKSIRTQIAEDVPVKYIKILTHNIFDYGCPTDFRRETLVKMIDVVKRLAEKNQLEFAAANTAEIAAVYRAMVPLPAAGIELKLDVRGR